MNELLRRFKADWLTEAELSVTVKPPSDCVGLSLFFHDPAELLKLAEQERLGRAWWEEILAVHNTFGLVPRFWVKLSFAGLERVAITRYFVIPDGSGNPLTTLRLLVRRLGATCPPNFAAAFEPYLTDPQVGWFVSQQQRGPNGSVRFSARLAPTGLLPYLRRATDYGLVSEAQLDFYTGLAVPAGDRIYVTLVVGDPAQCAVDFRISASPHRYLKCRFRREVAEWTKYGPCSEWL